MKVSCFTFIRNGTMLGYPFIESILSALPICDEFIVAVGDSEDNTLSRIRAIGSDKIRIISTQWNEKMQDRGFVYAQQKMIAQYNCTGDWAFYLEGDEILHESDIHKIRISMKKHLKNQKVEALAFNYHHFFGSPDFVAISPAWYRQECRIIRNTIRSWAPDGLYSVVMDKNKTGRYPRAVLIDASIYHYGHVRSIQAMRKKNQYVGKYWKHDHSLFNGYQTNTHQPTVNQQLKYNELKFPAMNQQSKNGLVQNQHVPSKMLKSYIATQMILKAKLESSPSYYQAQMEK